VETIFDQNGITLLIHPLYSPDNDPCDFFLFPRTKKVLKVKCFADVEYVKTKMKEALKGVTFQAFQDYFEKWKIRLERCIASNAQYFEED
jgi:hypothetical protein